MINDQPPSGLEQFSSIDSPSLNLNKKHQINGLANPYHMNGSDMERDSLSSESEFFMN